MMMNRKIKGDNMNNSSSLYRFCCLQQMDRQIQVHTYTFEHTNIAGLFEANITGYHGNK